ncbi:MAG TPA: LLM class flavin-dependent oxidoreductase, partial [Acidimicrobiales bacterium]|nr:LLM class flavin-dependent oxidoreductase [Acidimicrobiales bacterium]
MDDAVSIIPKDKIVYGIQLPVQAQTTIMAEPWELESGPAEMARVARQADESGYFYVAVCDHTIIPRRLSDAMSTTWYDTVATLGWLAAITTRTRLLSHVYVAALRHPLRAAKEFATLDVLSGGRLIIGVGAGHVAEEFDLLGPPFEERGQALDEALESIALAMVEEFPELPGPR